MVNLTLYTTTAVLVLDNEGHRLLAKYYQPPHALLPDGTSRPSIPSGPNFSPHQLSSKNPFSTLKEQRAFEKVLFEKTSKKSSSSTSSGSGDILLYDGMLILFKTSLDTTIYVIGPSEENELMLNAALNSLVESFGILLRGQVEKRAVLENLDLITLAVDETFDDGIILETDPQTIASRVSRPRPDVNEIQINEQTIMNAYSSLKERVAQRILQGGL